MMTEDLPGTQLLFDDEGKPFPEPKKKLRKQSNQKMTLDEVCKALQTTHTLSTKKICELLMTYRPWVSKYILPKLDKIFLNSGHFGRGRKSQGWNWVFIVRKKLQNDELTESSWYKTSDFSALLKKSLTACTRQTINVSASVFVEEAERASFCEQYTQLEQELEENKKKLYKERSIAIVAEGSRIEDAIQALFNQYIGEKKMHKLKSVVSIEEPYGVSKRPLTPHTRYKMNWDYTKFQSVHDMRGYGGIDEIIYRNLFNSGAVKLVFNFVAPNGDIGEKIFYTYDDNDEKYRLEDGSPKWAVPYTFFLENKKI